MDLEKIDLNDVLAYVRVVDAGGFSHAARLLSQPKSSLSRRVARLESTLHVQLLHRTSRVFTLTDVGRALHEQATRSLALLGEATQAIEADSEVPRGTVRIGAPPGVGAELLPALIASFVARYPEVRVQVELGTQATDLVAAGFDMAIAAGPLRDSALACRKLQDMPFKLFASPAYVSRAGSPRTVDDLAKHSCILFNSRRASARWVLHSRRGRVEVDVRGAVASDDISFIRRVTLAGAGIAMLPDIVGALLLDTGALIRVLPNFHSPQHPLYLVFPSGPQLPLRVSKLRDHLLEEFTPRVRTARLDA